MIGLGGLRCGALWRTPVLAAALAMGAAAVAAPAEKQPEQPQAIPIRLKFRPGQLLRYNLKLSGQTAWTPQVRGVDWGQMATDLTFTLRAKALRPDGACTFDLLGEGLHSAGQTSAGKIAVAAYPHQSGLKARGKGTLTVSSDRSPLQHPMTTTFGPRADFRFGTGLAPLAIYMLPHVDHRFWTLLTVAPIKPVTPGQQWDVDFDVPVPGAQGKPLDIRGTWKVHGWEKYGRREVLAITLAAQLDLKDSNVLLRNGDLVHVVTGTYAATGKVLWDVRGGVLCGATAEEQILLSADRPVPRALRSHSSCSLQLLAQQDP